MMLTAHPDFAPRYQKLSSMPGKGILPPFPLVRGPGPAVPASVSGADRTNNEHDSGGQAASSSSLRQSVQRVGQSREFIERHLDQPMKIAMLAASAGVSVSHFFKLFKEDTGCTPLVYMTRLKLERAREWLLTTDRSIKLIAADLGYHDPLYFSRVFKSCIGMAPKAYRRSKRNGQGQNVSAIVR